MTGERGKEGGLGGKIAQSFRLTKLSGDKVNVTFSEDDWYEIHKLGLKSMMQKEKSIAGLLSLLGPMGRVEEGLELSCRWFVASSRAVTEVMVKHTERTFMTLRASASVFRDEVMPTFFDNEK